MSRQLFDIEVVDQTILENALVLFADIEPPELRQFVAKKFATQGYKDLIKQLDNYEKLQDKIYELEIKLIKLKTKTDTLADELIKEKYGDSLNEAFNALHSLEMIKDIINDDE